MRAFVRAHHWFFVNCETTTPIAMEETRISRDYAERAWDEYAGDAIFPRDGDASDAAVQALIEISSLIRTKSDRVTPAADYINRDYLHQAQRDLASSGG
jgi:hypothetical protein